MPLDTAGLQPALQEFFENTKDYAIIGPDGLDLAATNAALGAKWGEIMAGYASSIVPASTTVSSAASALASALASGFGGAAAAGAAETAFAAFAATVGLGMAPGFTATPPPGPVGFVAQMAIPQTTHAGAATAFAGLIDTWMRSGTAVPSGGGPSVNWL